MRSDEKEYASRRKELERIEQEEDAVREKQNAAVLPFQKKAHELHLKWCEVYEKLKNAEAHIAQRKRDGRGIPTGKTLHKILDDIYYRSEKGNKKESKYEFQIDNIWDEDI